MDFPAYPAFRPLALGDRAFFVRAFREHPPELSEYTFTNLFAWRGAYGFEVSRRDGFLLLAARLEGQRRYFAPIGPGQPRALMASLLRDEDCRFIRLPETVASQFAHDSGYSVKAVPDQADYVYSAQALISLKGNKYDGKRNQIKRFLKFYAYEYVPLTADTLEECWSFVNIWCEERVCDQSLGLQAERRAIREILDHYDLFGLSGAAVRVQGEIVAVAIAEPLNPETLVLHVMKAFSRMQGLYQTMLHEFLSRAARGFAMVNLEQDLGLEGLRRSKQSYHPLRQIPKYTLAAAGS